MPRNKEARNSTNYRYKVTLENGEVKYYVSQQDVQDEYDLNRTAVYLMIKAPDAIARKKHNIVIEKLAKGLPVYDKNKRISFLQDGNLYYRYDKIQY